MNMTVTNCDTGNVILGNTQFEDGLLTLAGATTVKAGTILARDTTTGKYVLFVKGGTTNGNGVPKAVMTYEVTVTGAGDKSIRPAIEGQFRKERLVIAADGNATNIDATVTDALRDYGLVAISVKELGAYDNQ
jgi:hypothetical protein